MANFFSLPIADQAKLAQDSLFKYYGVTIPVTTEQSKNNLIKAQNSYIPAINQINSALWQGPLGPNGQPNPSRAAAARAANNAPIPPEIKNQLVSLLPAGYTFDGTLGQFANTLNAVSTSVDNVIRNEIQLPPMGSGVTYNPNNTTPPVGTVVAPLTPTLPTNTTPATTTAPSTNASSSTISNILTAAAVIGGGALIVNALNNRVQNSTATPVPPADNPNPIPASTAAFDDANASPQSVIDPNSDPNTNIGAEAQTPKVQQPINPNTDPNTNIGTEAQDLVYDPLLEPPITNDGDEFSGIDEQVQRQKDLEDGSLEFAGIDEQIAANENALQEPPLLSDEEIEQQLRLAAGQEETIAEQKVPDEFDGIDAQVAANKAQADLDAQDAAVGGGKGISTALNDTRSTATTQDTANFQQKPDWRARLSLAPNSNYLYNVPKGQAGILAPLQATDGVIFPYTPGISVTYSAGYDPSDLIHSNYKVYQYKGSSVDTVSITADFTAQDTTEANYLLAVIHFFRSVTKMFYGQDQNPNNGVPPPLCYLSGFGAYTFDAHPLVVTNFTYSTPTEVDYIRAGSQTNQPGVNVAQQNNVVNSFVPSVARTAINGLAPKTPNFSTQNSMINSEATYVPTKLQLQITCIPIVTRNDISNKFSLKEYATGALLRGSKRSGGGIW